jgi:hypothetical protein
MRYIGRLATLVPVLCLATACAGASPEPPRAVPPPTHERIVKTPAPQPKEGDNDLDGQRQAWIESMHRHAPGVDWREIERENRERTVAGLSDAAGPAAAGASGNGALWSQRGAFNQTGRTWVTAIAADGHTLLIGSGDVYGGGLFSGTLGSASWVQRGHPIGLGVQQLVVVPGPPETWIAVANNESEVHVSTNHGATWTPANGLQKASCGLRITRLLRQPGAARQVYLLATNPCLGNSRFTLLRSDNAGHDFAPLLSDTYVAAPDMWMSRVGPGPLYLLTDKGFEVSTDAGASFRPLGSLVGFFTPGSPPATLRLAGSEAGAPSFYAVISESGQHGQHVLFASEDGGLSWERRGVVPANDFYNSITASISKPGVLLLGGINVSRSANGGVTFESLNDWTAYRGAPEHNLHADLRGLDCVFYHGKEILFADTDGGTYVSKDFGVTFDNVTQFGMFNQEYYSTLTGKDDPSSIAAGSQDQGLQLSAPAAVAATSFDQVVTGDWGHLTSRTGGLEKFYAVYPGHVGLYEFRGMEGIPYPDAAFALLSPIAMTAARFGHTATLLQDGTVLIAGGRTGSGVDGTPTNTAELFDPAQATFISLSPNNLTTAREAHTATLLANGKVLIAGGSTGAAATNTAELFDPATGSFTPLPPMTAARARHTATLLRDGRVLIAGGDAEPAGTTNTAELFDPASGAFTPLPAMSLARSLHTATLLADGRVLIAGGLSRTGGTDTAELFYPAAGTFSLSPNNMTAIRHSHTATLLGGGKVLIAGGESGSGKSTSTAELFDPASGTFTLLSPRMTASRSQHTATLLPSEKVLLAGGDQEAGFTSTVDVFDPVAATFAVSANDRVTMTTARGGHTATLLPRGVLITGGDTPMGPTNTAELGAIRNGDSFMPDIVADPVDDDAVYLTGDPLLRLHKDTAGWHWTPLPQDFSADSRDYLTALTISGVDQRFWYAASAQGRLWYSHDQGATWAVSSSTGPGQNYLYGTALLASPTLANTCVVGGSGYNGSPIYKTTDGGVTWQEMGHGLPRTLVLGLAFDDPVKQNLYAVADAGAFVFDQASETWKSIVAGNAPIDGYWSVEGVPALPGVRFGTYGQGVWDYTPVGSAPPAVPGDPSGTATPPR